MQIASNRFFPTKRTSAVRSVQYCNDGENISKATSIAGYSDGIPYQLVSNSRTKTSPCLFEVPFPSSKILDLSFYPAHAVSTTFEFDDKMKTRLLQGSE